MLDIKMLEKKLDNELESFSMEIESIAKEGGTRPISENDLHWVARHTFYTLSGFKNEILNYLKDK